MYRPGLNPAGMGMSAYRGPFRLHDYLSETLRKFTFPWLARNFSVAQVPSEWPELKTLTQAGPTPFEPANPRYAASVLLGMGLTYVSVSRTDWSIVRGFYDDTVRGIFV